MKKRRVKKKYILIIFLILLVGLGIFLFVRSRGKKELPPAKEIEVVDTIDNFDYELNDNETEYYNEVFNSLKELLSQEEYENKDYAVLVGKLFLIDFYDLNSKLMKSDVGGTQFVYSEYRNDFEKGAIDTVYDIVESNVYGDRKQTLPIVTSVENTNLELKLFEYNGDIDYDAYYLTMKITYETDMGYPTDVLLVLIHNNDKLEIAKMETL